MWSCRFRKLPFLSLSPGEWQARPGPHRQVPTLPSSCQPARASLLKPVALLTRLKEGTSRRTPPHGRARDRGTPAVSGGFFFSVSHSKKNIGLVPCFRSQPDAGHHRDLPPTIGTAVLSQLHHEATIEDVSRLTEQEKMAVPRRPAMPPRLGTSRLGTGHRGDSGDGSPRFFGRTKISTLVCSVEHTRAVSVGSLFSLSPYFAGLVGSFAWYHHPPRSPAFSSQWFLSPCAVRFPSRAQETVGHGTCNSGGQADDASRTSRQAITPKAVSPPCRHSSLAGLLPKTHSSAGRVLLHCSKHSLTGEAFPRS